jgi:hypothetical protein
LFVNGFYDRSAMLIWNFDRHARRTCGSLRALWAYCARLPDFSLQPGWASRTSRTGTGCKQQQERH